MGKKNKLAKGRLDKYYHLAKEQGYRSRAAFKIIQLNKKYNFLSSARTCLDLCAAPGGWLQVASKNMPVNSLIVGVDLAPIKPIRNCQTFTEDITTQKCRDVLKKTFKTLKAEVVLHDGSPNVGQSWVQDAFGQSELVLHSLKLAVEFLAMDGTFVTKVFRSADYNSLIWVFGQLFKKVEATKPPASRNESAEIFVVCRGFLAPKKIDPKLLDSKYVFKEVQIAPKEVNVLLQTKEKRHREGYEDGNYTLFKSNPIGDFVNSDAPLQLLSTVSQFKFDSPADAFYANHPKTTAEIRYCCEDLKILSRKDFKDLLKWRVHVKADFEALSAEPKVEEVEVEKELTPEEQEQALDKELEERLLLLKEKKRKEKKKANKKKRKQMLRKNLKLNVTEDLARDLNDQTARELFSIPANTKIDSEQLDKAVNLPSESEGEEENDESSAGKEDPNMSDEEKYINRIDETLETMYSEYLEMKLKKKKKSVVDIPREGEITEDLYGDNKSKKKDFKPKVTGDIFESDSEDGDDENEDDDEEQEEKQVNPDGTITVRGRDKKSAIWWQNSVFSNDIVGDALEFHEEEKEGSDEEEPQLKFNKEQNKKRKFEDIDSAKEVKGQQRSKKKKVNTKEAKKSKKNKKDDEETTAIGGFEEVPANIIESDEDEAEKAAEAAAVVNAAEKNSDDEYDSDDMKEALALGMAAVKTGKLSEMVDDAYNRYAWNDPDLPSWFVDDEREHRKPQLPVTKEMVTEIKERFKAINARPLRKVAEAKARKKRRTMKKLGEMQSKAVSIHGNKELTDREKLKQIQKLYKGGVQDMKKPGSVSFVVSRKFQSDNKKGGKKGGGKLVDLRMKKDKRAADARDKKRGKKGGKPKGNNKTNKQKGRK